MISSEFSKHDNGNTDLIKINQPAHAGFSLPCSLPGLRQGRLLPMLRMQ